jgi:hypothetical protein
MIPYYWMLDYWALGQTDGARVEARKAGALLARNEPPKTGGCRGAGLLSYVSGQPQLGRIFFRAARALGLRDVAEAAAKRYGVADAPDTGQTGDLIVLVEHGFVAHRTHQDIHVPILGDELKAMQSEEGDSVAAAIGRASARLLRNLVQQAEWGYAYDEALSMQGADAMEGAYICKLAWPAYRLDAHRAAAARVIAKFQLARKAEQKAGKQGGETAGCIMGCLANVAGNLSERADTRGWLHPGVRRQQRYHHDRHQRDHQNANDPQHDLHQGSVFVLRFRRAFHLNIRHLSSRLKVRALG